MATLICHFHALSNQSPGQPPNLQVEKAVATAITLIGHRARAIWFKKASDCETLQKDKSNAEAKIQVLTLQIRDLQKEHDQQIRDLNKDRETQIRELSTEMDRRVSDARKDALLAQEKALAAQERELNAGFQEQLREADKTTSRLQVIIEGLQEQLARMKPDAGDGNGN